MSTAEQELIHGSMTIEDIFAKFPQKAQLLAQELTRAGLNCHGCHARAYETLENGMLSHGMNEAQMQQLIERLNKVLAEKTDLATISLTPKAAEKFKEACQEEGKEGWSVRFDERMAGCSGFEYVLDFSRQPNEDDQVFESHGIQIHVRKSALPRLLGCVIDFVEGLHSGFKIVNPNVKASCGCGSSHGY